MMNNVYFKYLVLIVAIFLSISAGYYSIFGLMKLFAGVKYEIMILGITMEISKLVLASLLYRIWNDSKILIKSYLIFATVILVTITSIGVYGFLSSAYQKSYTEYDIHTEQMQFIDSKKLSTQNEIQLINDRIISVDNSINTLRSQLTNTSNRSVDKKTGEVIVSQSASARRSLQQNINSALKEKTNLENQIKENYAEIDSLNNSIISATQNNDVVAKLGPLKYISEITGYDMKYIVNILIILIMIVLDPLAIVLVIIVTQMFNKNKIITTPPQTVKTSHQKDLTYEHNTNIEDIINSDPDFFMPTTVNEPDRNKRIDNYR